MPCYARRMNSLIKLEEEIENIEHKFQNHQQLVKQWFEQKKSCPRNFEIGDLVLKWDKVHEDPGKHTKFHNLWLRDFVNLTS